MRAEFRVTSLPRGYRWAVYACLKEALYALEGRPVTVYSMPEGALRRERVPNGDRGAVRGLRRVRDRGAWHTALLQHHSLQGGQGKEGRRREDVPLLRR